MGEPKPPDSTPLDELPRKDIVVPKEVIRPFGRGLSQLIAEPMRTIRDGLPNLTAVVNTDKTRERAEDLVASFGEFSQFLTDLETAREVKIVPHGDRWTLTFSPERDEVDELAAGEVIMDTSLVGPFASAFGDKAFNKLVGVVGFSSLIPDKEAAKNIHQASLEITQLLEPFRQRLDEIRITTDQQGNVTLNPIPSRTLHLW